MTSPIIFPAANAGYASTRTGERTGYGFTRFMKASGNLYFNSDKGVWRKSEPLDTPAHNELLMMGLYAVQSGVTSGTNVITAGEFTQYKALIGTKDAKDNLHLGIPSVLANGPYEWSTNIPNIRVYLPHDITVDYFVQLYRTRPFATADAIDDNYYLVHELQVTSAHITAGYVTFIDRTADAARGAALYTNVDIEGSAQINYRPGLVKDMTAYAGRAWYANYRGRYQGIFAPVSVTDDAGEIGVYAENCATTSGSGVTFATTSGSPTITYSGAHNFTPKEGAMIRLVKGGGTGDLFPAGTTILSYTSTTIVCSANATASASGMQYSTDNVYVGDYLRINNVVLHFVPPPPATTIPTQTSGGVLYVPVSATSGHTTAIINSLVGEMMLYNRYRDPDTYVGPTLHIVENEIGILNIIVLQHDPTYGYTLPTITTNNTLAFTPEVTDASFLKEDKEEHKLLFSKFGQAEAVPLENYLYIGARNFPIYRIVALENHLLVFKQDGLFAVTGYDAFSFEVRCLDPSLVLTHWNSVATLGNVCYALTNKGVVAIDGAAATPISGDIHQRLSDLTNGFELQDMDKQYWTNAEIVPNTHTYLLSLSDSRDERSRIFAYDIQHGLWSEWYSHIAASIFRSNVSQYDNKTRFVSTVGNLSLPSATLFEIDHSLNNDTIEVVGDTAITSYNYVANTITPNSLYLPLVSPMKLHVDRTDTTYTPTVGVSTLSFSEDITADDIQDADIITASYPIPVLLVWAPFTAESPTNNKHFDKISFSYRGVTYTGYKVFFSTDFSKDGDFWPTLTLPNSHDVSRSTTDIKYSEAHSIHVPRACRRGTRLIVGAYYNELDRTFILESADIDYLEMVGAIKRNV